MIIYNLFKIGFEFISNLDEALMSTIKFDPYREYEITNKEHAKIKSNKILFIIIYDNK